MASVLLFNEDVTCVGEHRLHTFRFCVSKFRGDDDYGRQWTCPYFGSR